MIQVQTAMRAAFRTAFNDSLRPVPVTRTTSIVHAALRRNVGLTTRKTMWSIQRGKR